MTQDEIDAFFYEDGVAEARKAKLALSEAQMTDYTELIARVHSLAGMVSQEFIDDVADALEAKQQPEPCCGEFATCDKPCTPRGEHLANGKQPVDCGMCESFVGCVNSPTKAKEICLDGDHYQGLPIVQLYRKE